MFWADHLPAHIHAVARQMADEDALDLLGSARLFALLSLTLADASVCSWDNKYHYYFWRPVTQPDPGWQPLLMPPPRSPST